MIDARELHIGAHVDVGLYRVRICRIGDNNEVCCQIKNHMGFITAKANHLQPIAVTASLLEEMGFEHQENGEWLKGWGNGELVFVTIGKKYNTLYVRIVGHIYWMGNHSTIPSKLHILENLIWIMINKELIK